jgi:hypothetical protein
MSQPTCHNPRTAYTKHAAFMMARDGYNPGRIQYETGLGRKFLLRLFAALPERRRQWEEQLDNLRP